MSTETKGKRGRKKYPAEKRKSQVVKFYLTPPRHAALKAAAAYRGFESEIDYLLNLWRQDEQLQFKALVATNMKSVFATLGEEMVGRLRTVMTDEEIVASHFGSDNEDREERYVLFKQWADARAAEGKIPRRTFGADKGKHVHLSDAWKYVQTQATAEERAEVRGIFWWRKPRGGKKQ